MTEMGVFGYSSGDLSLNFRSEWVYPFVILKQVVVSLFWRFENAVTKRKTSAINLSEDG